MRNTSHLNDSAQVLYRYRLSHCQHPSSSKAKEGGVRRHPHLGMKDIPWHQQPLHISTHSEHGFWESFLHCWEFLPLLENTSLSLSLSGLRGVSLDGLQGPASSQHPLQFKYKGRQRADGLGRSAAQPSWHRAEGTVHSHSEICFLIAG